MLENGLVDISDPLTLRLQSHTSLVLSKARKIPSKAISGTTSVPHTSPDVSNARNTQHPKDFKIFLSYRRQDSEFISHHLYDKLKEHFGSDSVFMDVDAIPIGTDFRIHLRTAVERCDVMLAVIGDRWLDSRTCDGKRRIDDPRDFVRFEILTAMQRGIPIVPVLAGNVDMPSAETLPEVLSELAYRNAAFVRAGRDRDADVTYLIQGLESLRAK